MAKGGASKVRVSKVGVDGDGKGVASMVGEGVTDRFLITFDPAFSSLPLRFLILHKLQFPADFSWD